MITENSLFEAKGGDLENERENQKKSDRLGGSRAFEDGNRIGQRRNDLMGFQFDCLRLSEE